MHYRCYATTVEYWRLYPTQAIRCKLLSTASRTPSQVTFVVCGCSPRFLSVPLLIIIRPLLCTHHRSLWYAITPNQAAHYHTLCL
jgi:hypothetical protein